MSLAGLWQRFRRYRWSGHVVALALIGGLTAVVLLLRFQAQPASSSMIYLLAVLAIAVNFGGGPAVLASLAAFGGLSILFAEPLDPLPVYDPSDVLVMYTFLVISVFTGQLAAMQRQRAREARQREREAVISSDLTRLVMGSDLSTGVPALAERLHDELGLAAAVVEVADPPSICVRSTQGDPEAVAGALAGAGQVGSRGGAGGGRERRWLMDFLVGEAGSEEEGLGHRLQAVLTNPSGREVGRIAIARAPAGASFTSGEARLLESLAAQLSTVCERERLRQEATEGEILRRSDDLKTALLRAVSHDLRTPLASIMAAAGSLLEEQVGWTDEERLEFAATIKAGAERLNQIVENLLDISRIESGSLHPAKDWYELWVLVNDVLARLRAMTAEHPLVVELPEDLPLVPMDYVQISEVLVNLVENATYYTPPGTEISLSARLAADGVEVAVADRGPGIPPTALTRLFEPFYRLDSAGTRPHGAGLGLAVAKGLVEAHGGRIWAENRPGGGARFVFVLPLGSPEQEPAALEEVRA